MDSGLLLFTISGVRVSFIVRNPRSQITVIIIIIRLLILLLIDGVLMDFTSRTPPVIPDTNGSNQVNTLFKRDGAIVPTKFLISIFLNK